MLHASLVDYRRDAHVCVCVGFSTGIPTGLREVCLGIRRLSEPWSTVAKAAYGVRRGGGPQISWASSRLAEIITGRQNSEAKLCTNSSNVAQRPGTLLELSHRELAHRTRYPLTEDSTFSERCLQRHQPVVSRSSSLQPVPQYIETRVLDLATCLQNCFHRVPKCVLQEPS